MDVELYIYDLSQGMARQYSRALTGTQIDAIYHTSVVFGGVEYFFGQGIHRKVPGSTHHGRPMKITRMGQTELPPDVIEEYLQSLDGIYTPESYDLFENNCNSFTQDLTMFLVGKSIPEEIRHLPATFLRTPIGQMLRGQLDNSMRQMVQAPDAVAGRNVSRSAQPAVNGNGVSSTRVPKPVSTQHQYSPAAFINGKERQTTSGTVKYPQNAQELDKLLKEAEQNCAAIFFTSATCPPCKILYGPYDELAAESGDKITLIKVDVGKAYDIGRRYQIRATPTFITFLKGQKDQEWSGAHEARLRGNIRLLVQMSNPQHAHTRLRLPSFQHKIQTPIMYTKVPPLEKLTAKIGERAQDQPVKELVGYIKSREQNGMAQTPIPDLQKFCDWVVTKSQEIPLDAHFAVVDLLRIAAADPRVSSFLAAEDDYRTLKTLVPQDQDFANKPYNVQVVTLQLFCNLFGSPVFQQSLDGRNDLCNILDQLASVALLTERDTTRTLASALIHNLASINHNDRLDGNSDSVDVSEMSSLEAALTEAVVKEDGSVETLRSMLLALGLMLYASPLESSIRELCMAMDVRESLKAKSKVTKYAKEPLIKEVGEELLAKGNTS